MDRIDIVRVVSAQHQRQFLALPQQLHGHDSHWSPNLAWDESRLLGFTGKHPFPRENEVQAWLAFRGNKPVARLATTCCHNNGRSHTNWASFGFFAASHDQAAVDALLEKAAVWCLVRNRSLLRGPFSPSINYSVGVLQDGCDEPASFQIPHNPSYYSSCLAAAGLQPIQDLYALKIEDDVLQDTSKRLMRVAECLQRRKHVSFRAVNRARFRDDLHLFLSIAQQSLQRHWGFLPFSSSEREQIVSDLRWAIDPNLLQFAEIDGQTIGAALAIADFAPCLKRSRGRLTPWCVADMWWAKKHSSRYRVVAANILPEFQRLGLAPALMGHIMRRVLDLGGREIEFSWIAESNPLSHGTITNGGAVRSKTLRVFEGSCQAILHRRAHQQFSHPLAEAQINGRSDGDLAEHAMALQL